MSEFTKYFCESAYSNCFIEKKGSFMWFVITILEFIWFVILNPFTMKILTLVPAIIGTILLLSCQNSTSSNPVVQSSDSLYFIDVTETHFIHDPEAHVLNPYLVDVNGDGFLDVVMALELDENRLYLNDGTGKFTWVKNTFSPVKNDTEHVRVADFDGDGNIDVIFVSEDDHNHEYYLGNGDGTFRDVTDRLPAFSEGNGLAVADVNSDGLVDIIVGNSGEQGQNFLWLNDSENPGFFIDATNTHLPQVNDATQFIALEDLNGDGHLDMVIGNEVPPNRLLLNDGTGKFIEHANQLELLVPLETRMVLLFDVDGDGDKDIVFSNLTSNGGDWDKDPQMRILINDGNANFKDETKERMPENTFSSYASQYIDFDQDGDLDLIVGTIDIPGFKPLEVKAYENDGKGFFTDVSNKVLPSGLLARGWDMTVGDVNGDGIDDLIIGGWGTQARLLFGKAISK